MLSVKKRVALLQFSLLENEDSDKVKLIAAFYLGTKENRFWSELLMLFNFVSYLLVVRILAFSVFKD